MCVQEHIGAQGSEKKALDPTGAGGTVAPYVGAGNLTQCPGRANNKHS